MKIAIVKLSALGDIVHAMVVLQFIKNCNKKMEIDWVVEESYKKLLEFHPDINKIHVVKLKKAKQKKSIHLLLNELWKVRKFGSYDLVIDMQGLFKSAIISYLIPSQKTLGFDASSIRESIASFFYNKTFKFRYDENIIERNLAIINFALKASFDINDIYQKTPFLYPGKKYVSGLISSSKYNILLIPGASHSSKCYPTSKLAEIVALVDANFIIIWGNLEEKKMAKQISTLAPLVKICDNIALDSLISLISQVDIVIGPDTGPTHMAWALNIPSITLFGPTPGKRNTFITGINKIIESKSIVNPYKINKKDISIKNIDVNDIVKIVKSQLKSEK